MANSVPIVVAVNGDTVTFDIDWSQARRVVHIGAEHAVDPEPALLGHSIGRWDGTALIVDTIGFSAHAEGMGLSFPRAGRSTLSSGSR